MLEMLRRRALRILVVEDDTVLAAALTRALIQAAYTVDLAESGHDANRAIDWTRARRLRAEVELGEQLPAPATPEPDGAFARIGELPPEHRAVVVLRYVLEYTPGEIAELLDLPRGTVNSRLRRGLDRMKELEA